MTETQRPIWLTALAGVCVAALVINVPRDLFFAETRDVEVWLGFEVILGTQPPSRTGRDGLSGCSCR